MFKNILKSFEQPDCWYIFAKLASRIGTVASINHKPDGGVGIKWSNGPAVNVHKWNPLEGDAV